MDSAVVVFVIIFAVLIAVPCTGIAWLGKKLIDNLGKYPSKTPMIQTSIIFKLAFIEIVSFTLLLLFFKILVAD